MRVKALQSTQDYHTIFRNARKKSACEQGFLSYLASRIPNVF